MSKEDIRAEIFDHIDRFVWPKVRANCEVYCRQLVASALAAREKLGHEYTGNFLNSIVAVVYEDQEPTFAYFAYQTGIKPPIRYEMTRKRAGHGGRRLQTYVFHPDYSGDDTVYTPQVKTKEDFGYNYATEFVMSYRPKKVGKFVIVVAYTSPYANFIEEMRQTSGISAVYEYVQQTAPKVLSRK